MQRSKTSLRIEKLVAVVLSAAVSIAAVGFTLLLGWIIDAQGNVRDFSIFFFSFVFCLSYAFLRKIQKS